MRVKGFLTLLSALIVLGASGAPADSLFRDGSEAYRNTNYSRAAQTFREAVARQPGAGSFQNLGNAEWQQGQTGPAILAWERALWVDPFLHAARNNLRFARKLAQLESPELAWYEVVSTWLPLNWWAWIAALSFWVAIGMATLPGILRLRKAAWQQALAALGFTLFLLSVPAHAGTQTRARLGFILQKDTPLRLTPTAEAQPITHLAAGEPARWERLRGQYVLIRTSHSAGWVERGQLGLICPTTGAL